MAWATTKGFNFRGTLGAATDLANEVFIKADDDQYPTNKTIGGETVVCGVDNKTLFNVSDRSGGAGNDRRLRGICYNPDTVDHTFRVDLPAAGQYKVRIALGDPNYSAAQDAVIKDNTTTLLTLSDASVATNSFLDASNTELPAATWDDTGGAQATLTFATTTFILVVKASIGTRLAHIEIEQVTSGSSGFSGAPQSTLFKLKGYRGY